MHDDRVPLANRRSFALAHPGELIARPKGLVIGPVKRAAISFLDGLLPADTLYPSLKVHAFGRMAGDTIKHRSEPLSLIDLRFNCGIDD